MVPWLAAEHERLAEHPFAGELSSLSYRVRRSVDDVGAEGDPAQFERARGLAREECERRGCVPVAACVSAEPVAGHARTHESTLSPIDPAGFWAPPTTMAKCPANPICQPRRHCETKARTYRRVYGWGLA